MVKVCLTCSTNLLIRQFPLYISGISANSTVIRRKLTSLAHPPLHNSIADSHVSRYLYKLNHYNHLFLHNQAYIKCSYSSSGLNIFFSRPYT